MSVFSHKPKRGSLRSKLHKLLPGNDFEVKDAVLVSGALLAANQLGVFAAVLAYYRSRKGKE